jgi:hypothetical protein
MSSQLKMIPNAQNWPNVARESMTQVFNVNVTNVFANVANLEMLGTPLDLYVRYQPDTLSLIDLVTPHKVNLLKDLALAD